MSKQRQCAEMRLVNDLWMQFEYDSTSYYVIKVIEYVLSWARENRKSVIEPLDFLFCLLYCGHSNAGLEISRRGGADNVQTLEGYLVEKLEKKESSDSESKGVPIVSPELEEALIKYNCMPDRAFFEYYCDAIFSWRKK